MVYRTSTVKNAQTALSNCVKYILEIDFTSDQIRDVGNTAISSFDNNTPQLGMCIYVL